MKSAVELWSIMIYNAPTEKTRKKKECKEAKKECWLFTSYCKQNDVNGLGAVSRNHLDAAVYDNVLRLRWSVPRAETRHSHS